MDLSIHALLGKYSMESLDVASLPKHCALEAKVERMKKDVRTGRLPIVRESLSERFAPLRDVSRSWVRGLKASEGESTAALTMAQLNVLWWGRAHVQLLGRAACEVETLTMGALMQRWCVLSQIAADESAAIAKAYDDSTWRDCVANISAPSPLRDGALLTHDADALAAAKRHAEVGARARQKGVPPQVGQDRSTAWKGNQALRAWGEGGDTSAPQQGKGFRGSAGWLKPLTKAQFVPSKGSEQ